MAYGFEIYDSASRLEFSSAESSAKKGYEASMQYIADVDAEIKNIEAGIDNANKKIEEYKTTFNNFVGDMKQKQAQAAKIFNETKGHISKIVDSFKSMGAKLKSLFTKLEDDFAKIKNSQVLQELASITDEAVEGAEAAASAVGPVLETVGEVALVAAAGNDKDGGLMGGDWNRDFSIYRPDGRAWVLNGLILIIAILIIVMVYLIYFVGCECDHKDNKHSK